MQMQDFAKTVVCNYNSVGVYYFGRETAETVGHVPYLRLNVSL